MSAPRRKVATISRKRQLSYGNQQNSPGRISVGCPKKQDWERCMDGFDGLKWSQKPHAQDRTGHKPQAPTEIDSNSDTERNSTPQKKKRQLTESQEHEIDVEESPVKIPLLQPVLKIHSESMPQLKSVLTPSGLRNKSANTPKFVTRQREKCMSPTIDFPDDITDFIAGFKDKKSGCNHLPRPVLTEDVSTEITSNEAAQSQDPLISEYESDGEGYESPLPTQKVEEDPEEDTKEDTDVYISQPPSSNSPESSRECLNKPTEWVRNIQWQKQTPSKHQEQQLRHESAKKKQKFEKDGLADRMQKVINRERVSYTMWKHRLNAKKQESDKCISVRVQCFSKCFSHYSAVCHCVEAVDKALENFNQLTVIFLAEKIGQIAIGDVLKIHPPWQKLVLPDGVMSILCTQHCQVVSRTESNGRLGTNMSSGSWMCPCSHDCTLMPTLCPYYAHPCSAETRDNKEAFNESCSSPSHLEQVTEPAPTDQHPHMDLLPAIEDQGGGMAEGITFTAIVQRLFRKRHATTAASKCLRPSSQSALSSVQLSLLLEDSQGTLCHLLLPGSTVNSQQWESLSEQDGTSSMNCEGGVYQFCGVRVVQRVTRSRAHSLFSVIDSVCQTGASSQQCPSFCYILSAPPGESSCVPVSSASCRQCPQHMSSLLHIHTVLPTNARCSVQAKVVHYQLGVPFVGELFMDEFSSVVVGSQDTNVSSYRPPMFTQDHHHGDIITFQGVVCGVDENTAYSWLECNRCHNDKLLGGTASNPFYYCRPCSEAVVDPVTKMHLEVFVSPSHAAKNTTVSKLKIKLLQKTIENLLPSSNEEDDEGYDVSCVLGKSIGPLTCLLQAASTDKECATAAEIQLK